MGVVKISIENNPAITARRRPVWLKPEGRAADIVLSTRITLSRNLSGFRFPHRAGTNDLDKVLNLILKRFAEAELRAAPSFYDLRTTAEAARGILVERGLLSPELAQTERPAGALVFRGEKNSVAINDDDHLRFQSALSGFEAAKAWKNLGGLYEKLSRNLKFARSSKLGFLTSSPTNVGSGLKVSFTCHLPGMALTKNLDKVFDRIAPAGIDIKGIMGQGAGNMSSVFRISNQATLGFTESEIISRTKTVLKEVLEAERIARREIRTEGEVLAADYVFRSLAVLSSARLMSAEESFGFLAGVRFGVAMGWIAGIDLYEVNRLMLQSQPGHLAAMIKGNLSDLEKDQFRADFLRRRMKIVKSV